SFFGFRIYSGRMRAVFVVILAMSLGVTLAILQGDILLHQLGNFHALLARVIAVFSSPQNVPKPKPAKRIQAVYPAAASLPEIKISASNRVPECVTPGRLLAYLKSRNPELNPRYTGIATEYMRLGEQLGVRWDFAFYQMLLETGQLTFAHGTRG